jgi:UDP-2,3-diacylglucosamine pyrophosphatase LpxH
VQLAVISDLHLGSEPATDLFGHDDAEFVRFLRFLERNFERFVLLGDIWETLTMRWGDAAAELRAARARHPEIAKRFERPQYRYVHGNHDLVAAEAVRAPDEYVVNADGMRIVMSHGHQGDALVMRARSVSELGVWLGAWIRRLGAASVYKLFSQLDAWRSGSTPEDDGERCHVRRWAQGHAEARAADIVVTGHTHRPVRAEFGSRLFLNSGSCAEGNLSFLSMDTRTLQFAVNQGY